MTNLHLYDNIMEYQIISDKIKNAIDKASNVLLVCHQNPDGDTLGSALSIAHVFDLTGKDYTVFCPDKPADFFSFLPKFDKLETKQKIDFSKFNLIMTFDCGDLEQTGLQEFLSQTRTGIVNIDHHTTNTRFGEYNLVDTGKASTTAILYHFFTKSQLAICRDIATCLLVGVLTDTGNFSNPATDPESLQIAARLVAKGARIREINKYVLRNKSINILKLWSRFFLRLKRDADLDLAWTVITQKDLKDCQVDKKELEGVANFFNDLADNAIALVLEELDGGEIKASLRTTRDWIDVSKFAKMMGGGGHAKAAGFRVRGRLLETVEGWRVV